MMAAAATSIEGNEITKNTYAGGAGRLLAYNATISATGPITADASAARAVLLVLAGTTRTKTATQSVMPQSPVWTRKSAGYSDACMNPIRKATTTSKINPTSSMRAADSFPLNARIKIAAPQATATHIAITKDSELGKARKARTASAGTTARGTKYRAGCTSADKSPKSPSRRA